MIVTRNFKDTRKTIYIFEETEIAILDILAYEINIVDESDCFLLVNYTNEIPIKIIAEFINFSEDVIKKCINDIYEKFLNNIDINASKKHNNWSISLPNAECNRLLLLGIRRYALQYVPGYAISYCVLNNFLVNGQLSYAKFYHYFQHLPIQNNIVVRLQLDYKNILNTKKDIKMYTDISQKLSKKMNKLIINDGFLNLVDKYILWVFDDAVESTYVLDESHQRDRLYIKALLNSLSITNISSGAALYKIDGNKRFINIPINQKPNWIKTDFLQDYDLLTFDSPATIDCLMISKVGLPQNHIKYSNNTLVSWEYSDEKIKCVCNNTSLNEGLELIKKEFIDLQPLLFNIF